MTPPRERTSDPERSKVFTLRLSPEEVEALASLAERVGWSRSAVLRYGINWLDNPVEIEKMRETEPPGYRRDF